MTTLLTIVEHRNIPGHVPTAGPVGRRLAARLAAADEATRVLTPPFEAAGWPDGVEVVVGDVTRPAESAAAFAGIRRLFLAGAVPETAYELVTLAREGGADRIVVLSSHGPEFEIQYEPEAWHWLAVEVVVERSGAGWTHLRPSPVMAHQTLQDGYSYTGSNWADTIKHGGVIREPYADARYPLIHEDDLAAVAVTLLADDRYAGRTVTAYGPPISPREQIRLIGQALGREIPFEEITLEQAAERDRQAGVAEELIALGQSVGADLLANPVEPDDTVARLLGRPPRSYAEWLADNLDAFRP
ncbi:NAD(P)H-binding protein [Nonomuraea sp. K274]|uniref:NAD(P)H-binding protein n=1 Tax=Nonomuraea cypriaca TaxID=1187855 RepID=A0A931A1E0_9ACTN|nr:NAD(P)H-binding protein [Nonomuraea cypriaca]MBF8184406.1 NAD(P)H-binding protein [Nonomuraea cypriaca]